jgi:hypothetical protein
VGNGAVVVNQQNLFSVDLETITETVGNGLSCAQITGDLGEIEFDRFCTKNNISYYKASSGAAPIDRIILTGSGKTIRIHVKAAVRQHNKKNCIRYNFKTSSSIAEADYYYCTGFSDQNHEKLFSLWIPYQNTKNKDFNVFEATICKWSEFQKTPSEVMDCSNILPFV